MLGVCRKICSVAFDERCMAWGSWGFFVLVIEWCHHHFKWCYQMLTHCSKGFFVLTRELGKDTPSILF